MLLSICIATRNRLTYLIETLNSIVPQLVDGVEIVIVDGASTDGTFEYFSAGTHHPAIRYMRFEKNGGLDQDYDLAVVHASGEYCWLFADDDIILPESIDRIVSVLMGRVSLVVVNSSIYDMTMSKLLHLHEIDPRSPAKLGPDDTDSLFGFFGYAVTFIGRIVIQRSFWLSRSRAEYYGTYFLHVAVIFQSPLPGDSVFIPTPCLGKRTGNESWSAKSFDIWNFQWPKMVWGFPNVSDSTKARVISKEPWNSVLQLLKFRVLGAYSIVEFRKHISVASIPLFRKIIFGAIAALPGSLLNTTAYLVALLTIPEKPTVIQEIANSRFSIVRRLKSILR